MFASTSRARSNYEIVRALHDWIDQLVHKRRDIATVTIQKHNDLALGHECTNACCARASVTARCRHDSRTRFTRALGCSIAAAVVHHDDFIRQTCRETLVHYADDCFLLIKNRDNDRYVAHRKASHALVK